MEKTLRDINKALARIEEGAYGKCAYCGKEIAEDRLMARPTSNACIECKEKLTSQ
ncbi:MAG: TraR/DksA C4-type zinc finger protein [Candidatus Parcubacteria bacterium]|nr:TraR/DksA C4-type zinc finger protein [Candidatus Parcubacteria bacterium]